MKYTFFNAGNSYNFKPGAPVYPPNGAPATNSLEFHKDLVRSLNRPDVYILTNRGEVLPV